MEKYNKLLRNITELIEKGLFTSKDLKKEVEEEFEVQKKIIEKLQKDLIKLKNQKKVTKVKKS